VQNLSDRELRVLRGIISQNGSPSVATSSGDVSFSIFASWMYRIFSTHVGGLKRNDPAVSGSMQEADGASGFTVALLQHCNASDACKLLEFPDKVEAVPSAVLPIDDQSITSNDESHDEKGDSVRTPRQGRRRKTLSRVGSRDKHDWHHGSESGSASSQARSRSSSRASDTSKPQQHHHSDILCLKGLPPSEAMLSRRMIRACSVDLSQEGQQASNFEAPQSFSEGGNLGQLDILKAAQKIAMSSKALDKAGGAPSWRKVKPVQEADTVLKGAVARLAELGLDDDGDNEQPEGHAGLLDVQEPCAQEAEM